MLIVLLWYFFCYSPVVEEIVIYPQPETKVIRYERPTKPNVVGVKKPRRSDRYTVVIAAAQENQPQLPYVGK